MASVAIGLSAEELRTVTMTSWHILLLLPTDDSIHSPGKHTESFKCYPLLSCSCYTAWGSPDLQRTAGDSLEAQRSGVRAFVTGIKQTGWGLIVSHILGDTLRSVCGSLCAVYGNCLSVTHHLQETTTDR